MPDSGQSVTINDVATAAGVSVRTASRVLNGSPKVNAATRARVQDVMRDLHFVPNLRARALASNRSFMLGFVHDDPHAEIADQMQRGIFAECYKHSYELLTHTCDHRAPDLVQRVMDFVHRTRVDGLVVIAPVSDNVELAQALIANGTPVVGVNSVALDHYDLMIVSRERDASVAIAEHFIDLGHKEIGFISGPLHLRAPKERMDGFMSALKQHDIEMRAANVHEGDWSFESGYEAARKMLGGRNRPTAIFASNDRMAAAVLKVAAENGIRVPQDLSVVGFDDSYLARVLTPALTTINRPIYKIGERAAQWLLEGKEGNARADESLLRSFDLRLTTRESTGPAPKR